VVSTQPGSHRAPAAVSASSKLYVDFTFVNATAGRIDRPILVQLLVDGSRRKTWRVRPAQIPSAPRFYGAVDVPLGKLPAGRHMIQVQLDAGNAVKETKEANNLLSRVVVVSGAVPRSTPVARPIVTPPQSPIPAVPSPQPESRQPLTIVPGNFEATTGLQFTGPVASFNDPSGLQAASKYSAVIDWGDGTQSAASIGGANIIGKRNRNSTNISGVYLPEMMTELAA
jgi:hypothetical protein